jgi:uncharacterized protein YutE (UPF0331/DUF86 family)
MVDAARLLALLDRLARETDGLRRLAALPDGELGPESDAMAAVKYRFVVAVEVAVDVSRHVAASEGMRAPQDMRDAFVVLVEQGWLPATADLPAMAGFRNLLVHGYAEVDDGLVRELLRTRLDDLDAFRRAVAQRVAGEDVGGQDVGGPAS